MCAFQAEADPFPQHKFDEDFFEKVKPYVWWLCIKKTHKDVDPELCDLAIRLLRQPPSFASIERIFSNFSFVQNKLRNRLGLAKTAKLAPCFRELRGSVEFDW